MPPITSARKISILDLPREIRETIWEYALLPPPKYTHHYLEQFCDSKLGDRLRDGHMDIVANLERMFHGCKYPSSPKAFPRAELGLLLVNKKVYAEAEAYKEHGHTALVCGPLCLDYFIKSFSKDNIHPSTAFQISTRLYVLCFIYGDMNRLIRCIGNCSNQRRRICECTSRSLKPTVRK